jgi:hypothetical protein
VKSLRLGPQKEEKLVAKEIVELRGKKMDLFSRRESCWEIRREYKL